MSAFADWESSPKAVKETLTTATQDMKAIEDLEKELKRKGGRA